MSNSTPTIPIPAQCVCRGHLVDVAETAAKKHTREKGVPFTTTLPPDVLDRLRRLAWEQDAPMSEILAEAVRRLHLADLPIPYRLTDES